MRFLLAITLTAASGCYHVALSSEARARIDSVMVVVGAVPVPGIETVGAGEDTPSPTA